jgi:tagatose 6-phosphate kinase
MIQCVGLNPAYQRTLTIKNFLLNSVNRVSGDVIESSAGKGINVSRVLKTLGHESVITGFVGGETGKLIEHYLSQENLSHDFVHTANKTRICTTILDPVNNTHTEIVEEGRPVSSSEIEEMYTVYKKNLEACTIVTISGTAPQQVPDDMYYHFVKLAQERGIFTLVDTQKTLLKECLRAKPFLIKINQGELGIAFRQRIDSSETLYNILQCLQEDGIEWVVITNGKAKTTVSHHGQYWDVIPPSIQMINPIGSGDATLAGIASAITRGNDVLQAIRFGIACGTANALTLIPGLIQPEDVQNLEQEVIVERKM